MSGEYSLCTNFHLGATNIKKINFIILINKVMSGYIIAMIIDKANVLIYYFRSIVLPRPELPMGLNNFLFFTYFIWGA